jgi:hypothetical protein
VGLLLTAMHMTLLGARGRRGICARIRYNSVASP